MHLQGELGSCRFICLNVSAAGMTPPYDFGFIALLVFVAARKLYSTDLLFGKCVI